MQVRDQMHNIRMQNESQDRLGWLAALTCAISLAALLLQYVLLVRLTLDTIGPAFATLRFFSYFTILANILVVLVTANAVRVGRGHRMDFFARATVRGAVALYIGVTGTIYFVILRHLWQPQGAQWWADAGLHYAVPVMYLAWWAFGARHGTLRWRGIAGWLLFPLGYLLWSFLRGAWVHEYPYPFIDVGALGWTSVLRNACGMMLVFVVLGGLLVAIDRWLRSRDA